MYVHVLFTWALQGLLYQWSLYLSLFWFCRSDLWNRNLRKKKTVDAFCIYKFELRKATTGIAWNEKKSLCWPKWSYFHQCKYMQDIWSAAAYLDTSIHYSSLTLAAFEPFWTNPTNQGQPSCTGLTRGCLQTQIFKNSWSNSTARLMPSYCLGMPRTRPLWIYYLSACRWLYPYIFWWVSPPTRKREYWEGICMLFLSQQFLSWPTRNPVTNL